MKKYVLGIVALGATITLLTSCGKAPQAEIDLANAAIEEASVAGAETYDGSNFIALQDSMKATLEEVEVQKSKFFGDYSASKESLSSIVAMAAEVKTTSETVKMELSAEIQSTLDEVLALIQTNKELIQKAPKGKEGTTALVAIQGELTMIEGTITESKEMQASGDYLESLDKAKIAKEKAMAINAELTTVIAKYQANVKARKG